MNKCIVLYFDLRLESLEFRFEGLIFKIEGTVLSVCSLAEDFQKILCWVSFPFKSKWS